MIFLAQIIIFICGASFVGSKNSCDRRTEVAHKNECFKLLDLDLRAQFAACKSNHTSTVNIICLKQIFHKFLTIYTQSPVIKDPGDSATSQSYQFNVLETSRPADQIKAKYNEHLWKRLIQNNKINLMSNNNSRKPLNIYIHFYSFKNNVYIKNQPVNDGDPNLLIHLGHADELTTGSNCIFGHQINTSNESFQFKSENCETRLPFICVKALETKSRCATFRTSPPGGHWVECDRPATLLDGSAYTISDTQKCCMYNVHWRVEFDEVRKTCSRFDARVFSYKSRGYKSALDSYAMYLNSNYDKGAIDDLFAKFWTSCKHKEQNKEDECADEEVKLEKAVADYGARINNGFEIVSFSTTEDEKKNMMFLPNYLNLTRVYKTLRFISNNFELNELRFKPLILTSDRSNCSFINANSLTDLNRDFLLDCLLADYELLTQNSVFLASRERTGHFIEMDRTQKRVLYNGETTAKMMGIEDNSGVSCFYFHRVSEQLAHVSLPFLNKCFHFSVIDLNSTEEIDQVTENNAFWPFEAANSSLVSTDNLNSIRIEELSGVLASLGVIKIECTSIAVNTVNRSDNFLIIGTANTSAEYFNCSRGLFQLKNLNEQYKSNDPSDRLAMLLSKLNLRALLLHSVSFIRHVVRLDCESTARQVWRQIESCRQFNEQRICPVECPVTCEWSSDGGVWQIHPFQYYLESSICKAAVHAGAFKSVSKQRRAVLFIGEANGLDDVYQLYNNRIQTYVWRPFERLISGAHAYSHISFNFDRHNVDLSNRVEPEPHNQFENGVILTRAIHFVGENETMSVGLKVYTNGYLKSIRFFPILVHKDLQDDDEYVDDSSVEEEFLHSTVSNGSTNVNYSLTDVTLTSESLNALNSYFELDVNGTRTGLKFPVNIARNGSLQDNFKLNLNHVAAFSSHEVRLNLKPVYQTQTRVRQLKCMWYISGLNVSDSTMRPCNLTIPSRIERFNTADITELDIVIYPILELTEPAQSTRKFMRVFYFSKTLNGANKCQNMGVEVRDECVCLPGFGGPMCAKTCDAGYFGSDCRFECPGLNCSGYLVCSIDPIGCRCAAGFKGYGCDEPCSKGVWGSECSFKCNCSGSFYCLFISSNFLK
jgi:endothelial-specific receptor tyrosine kinase